MKKLLTIIMGACLSLAMSGIFASTAGAQPTSLSITLTATYQNPNVKQSTADSGDITTTGTASLKISPQTLTSLIASNLGASLSGYTLIWDPMNSELGETNKNGDFDDVSSLLAINMDASGNGNLVTSGTSDTTDQIAQSVTTTSEWNVTFDDGNGNTFNVSGLVKYKTSLNGLSATQINNGASQAETISFSGSLNGFGTVVDKSGNTDNAVFSGTISGSGKGPAGS